MTGANHKISVVMAVYNSPQLIEKTVRSVLSQRGVSFQFIIVDDGSGLETKKVLNSYRDIAEIKLLEQPNSGLTSALIRGCKAAEGQYIARIDIGDEMLAGRLAAQAEVMDQDPTIGLVCSSVELVTEVGEALFTVTSSGEELERGLRNPLTSRGKSPFHSSVMFRRDVYLKVGGYRPEFYFAQDLDLWSRMIESCHVAAQDDCFTRAIYSVKGITARYNSEQLILREIVADLIDQRAVGADEHDGLAKAAKIRPSASNSATDDFAGNYFIGRCLMDTRSPTARTYLLRALKARPMSLKVWWAWCRTIMYRM